jgi:hypothetical protein
MKRTLRPLTPADVPALLAVFDAAGLHPNAAPQELHWKYWQERADWPASRSFVLTEGDELMAHGAVVPGWCAWGQQRMRVIYVIDWAARPGAVGAGVALMKHIGRQAQALLAIGGSAATLRILPEIGFRALGVATGYVRTLSPMRLLRGGTIPVARVLPRMARSLLWKLAAPRGGSAGWEVRALAPDEIGRIESVFPSPVRDMAVLERSVALFRYLLACPIVPMRLFSLERAGRVRGYFLLASAPGQVRIADCWVDSDELGDWRAMIQCAVAQAQHDRQAAEVVIWANDALLADALSACGFHARFQTPVQLRPTDAAALPPGPLRVQMIDCDGAYLNNGRPEYWA